MCGEMQNNNANRLHECGIKILKNKRRMQINITNAIFIF